MIKITLPGGITKLLEQAKHQYTYSTHDTEVFPEDTADSLTFTAGDANNSWTKDVTDGGDTHDGGNASASLKVSTVDFIALGARVGMTLDNDTNAESTTITAVATHELTGTLSGGESWDNGDTWSFSNVTGWQEILDSAGNKLSDNFSSPGHITAVEIDQVSVSDKYYILQIGEGDEDTEPIMIGTMRFISNVAAANFQMPRHYRIRSCHVPDGSVTYYRLKCETGGATMIGSTRSYVD